MNWLLVYNFKAIYVFFIKLSVIDPCEKHNDILSSTVKDVTTIQHKINIFGVTKAYYLSLLNF